MLIGARISGFATSVFSEETPKAIISNLPKIDYSKQCNEKGKCDRTIEDEVFSTLTKLSDRYLKRGMSKREVEKILSNPWSEKWKTATSSVRSRPFCTYRAGCAGNQGGGNHEKNF